MAPKPINYLADHHMQGQGSCSLPPQAARITGSYSKKEKSSFDEEGERGMGNPGQDLSITVHPQSTGAEPWAQAGKGLWGLCSDLE